jgi:hypothetical protein
MDWLLLLCMDAAVPVVLVWKTHSGEVQPITALMSGLLCLLVGNAIVLTAIHKRSRRTGQPTSKWLVLKATGLSVLAALVTSAAVLRIPQRNTYLDLALSDIPLSGIQPEQKRLVVELIRRRAANSREYDSLVSEAKTKPLSPSLYAPESFANEQVIDSTIAQLTKYADADFQYSQKQQALMSEFRQKMAMVDPEYLQSWDVKRQGEEAAEQQVIGLERGRLETAVSLYGYAKSHSKEISLMNGHLEFVTDALRSEFNSKQDESKGLYQKWQDATQGLVRRQQETRAQMGLP